MIASPYIMIIMIVSIIIMIVSPFSNLCCPKCLNELVGNFNVYPQVKNQLHLYLLFWDIAKTCRLTILGTWGMLNHPHENHNINL